MKNELHRKSLNYFQSYATKDVIFHFRNNVNIITMSKNISEHLKKENNDVTGIKMHKNTQLVNRNHTHTHK